MNIRELRAIIEDLDDDTEVRLMHQPNYPFEYSVSGAVTYEDLVDFQVNEHESDPDVQDGDTVEIFQPASGNDPGYFGRGPWAGAGILYLLEDQQLGYGTSAVWAADEALNG